MKRRALLSTMAAAGLCASAASAEDDRDGTRLSSNLFVDSSLTVIHYDGVTDDLLSAGLGADGLQGGAPAFVDPLNPTPQELRRRAIHSNYRGIVDMADAGGFGLFWGPGSNGGPELIPGWEYKAYFRARGPRDYVNNVTMVVQIPDDFDVEKRCIVVAPPSGSRGVYGGIATAEWGLFQGCAVALGGKGSGSGFHLLGDETAPYAVNDIDGVTGWAQEIGDDAQFRVKDDRRLRDFNWQFPNRIATKHAHSQINPERRWGEFALRSIEFAFWALNDLYEIRGDEDDDDDDDDRGSRGDRGIRAFTPDNTIVIASGVSNGAGVSIQALEQDSKGLIDGLVVSEPNLNPAKGEFVIAFGDDAPFDPNGLTLYDNTAMMGAYAPCAALDPSLVGAPLNFDPLDALPGSRANRCITLQLAGLLSSADPSEALAFLNSNGYAPAQNWGLPSHEWLNLWRTLNLTYGNSYGRFAVWDRLCGVSYGQTDATGSPTAFAEEPAKALFADSSGIPLGAGTGVKLIAEDAPGGPILENLAQSKFGLQDLNLDSALCFRYLSTGDPADLGRAPTRREAWNHRRVRRGAQELQTTGKTRGTPAIIIHGREDALVFPNFQSRAYYALNQQAEGANSRLSYWEVTPAQHFDAFISSLFVDPATGGAQFVPLHLYLTEGLELMLDHLITGAPLPPSQVIRAQARGADPYVAADLAPGGKLPPARANPLAGDRIAFTAGVLRIPE